MQTPKKISIARFTIATASSAGSFAHSAIAIGGAALDSLASSIASSYSLSKDQVMAALNQFRQAKLAEREAALNRELSRAVASGSLSFAQETKILSERSYVKARLATIKKIPNTHDRESALKLLILGIKQWAAQNSVPLRWLRASAYAGIA